MYLGIGHRNWVEASLILNIKNISKVNLSYILYHIIANAMIDRYLS